MICREGVCAVTISKIYSDKIGLRLLRFSTGAAMLASILLSVMQATPALAAPGSGDVVEGVSVPGAALGSTRAQLEAAFGEPKSCQNVTTIGDQEACSFDVED
jgi:hypothetical protein